MSPHATGRLRVRRSVAVGVPLVVIEEKVGVLRGSEVGQASTDATEALRILVRVGKMEVCTPGNSR